MFNHPGPLAPICITAAFITPPPWALFFIIAGCVILGIVILKAFRLIH